MTKSRLPTHAYDQLKVSFRFFSEYVAYAGKYYKKIFLTDSIDKRKIRSTIVEVVDSVRNGLSHNWSPSKGSFYVFESDNCYFPPSPILIIHRIPYLSVSIPK